MAIRTSVDERRSSGIVFLILLSIHLSILIWGAVRHSPASDEVGHLAAGISHWQWGTFDLYRVNPPLVRIVAALPVVLGAPEMDGGYLRESASSRAEFASGGRLIKTYGRRSFWYFALARWACIPFSIAGSYICFRWARELYGDLAGILATALWCFSPNIIAHAQMITPDVGATALGVAAAYLFWRWLRRPTWGRALTAGLTLGLAELTKTTWSVLFGFWPILWVAFTCMQSKARSEGGKALEKGGNGSPKPKDGQEEGSRKGVGWRHGCQMAVILLLGLYVLNLGYGFEGSFQRLDEYGFLSEALGGPTDGAYSDAPGRNRFAGTWMGRLPVPLPRNYLMGIDLQKWDFECKRFSYLRGEWRAGGWWYYYLYALAIKVPLGTWILVLLALLVGLFRPGYAAAWRDELVLLAPIAVVLTLVSSQTGFNHHLRYVLPVFPFAFIWMSKLVRAVEFGHRKIAAVAALALVWSVGSSLWVYPHSLSYFNDTVRGPKNGHAHLLNSNIDWGQDLLYLKRWLDEHPGARPLTLAYANCYDASVVGIEYTPPPREPQPGWHVLSVNKIRSRTRDYQYFLRFEPVAMAGYSIYIYHVTIEDANRVRRELGLPELSSPQQPGGGTDNEDVR